MGLSKIEGKNIPMMIKKPSNREVLPLVANNYGL
jgi:hypothetical protein